MPLESKSEQNSLGQHLKLRIPVVKKALFPRNFIQSASCEVRFPTLLEFEKSRPVEFQRALRQAFPHYEKQRLFQIAPIPGENEDSHVFQSRDRKSAVVFRPSAIVLETHAYEGFEPFAASLRLVLQAARKVVDVDFFSRIGLRYINAVPLKGVESEQIADWIRPDLVAGIDKGVFGTLKRYWHDIAGTADSGEYSFRHGIRMSEKTRVPEYILDYDFFDIDISRDAAFEKISGFHDQLFSFFVWSLGKKALESLDQPIGD